jgi:hypothetical protein
MLTNPRDAAAMLGGRIVESGQQAQALQEQTFADPNRPFRVTDPQAMARLTDMLMAGPMGFAPAGITAYHGSPYLFRQFDPTKKGTGEGAQAYGVGAGYTAEARPVAEGYRSATTRDRYTSQEGVFEPSSLEHLNVRATLRKDGIDKAIEVARKSAVDSDYPETAAKATRDLQTLERLKLSGGIQPVEGYLYKGDIPDEILPKFLDWDKPLSQQTNEIKSPFNLRVEKNPNPAPGEKWVVESNFGSINAFNTKKEADSYLESVTGGEVYQNIGLSRGTVNTSKLLEDSGLRGIRYLDQGSRGTSGQGTSNFIPFSPEDFKIQEINDIPVEDWISKGLL